MKYVIVFVLGGQLRWQSPISTWFLRIAISGTSANTLDWHGVPSGYMVRIFSKYSGFAGFSRTIFVTKHVPDQQQPIPYIGSLLTRIGSSESKNAGGKTTLPLPRCPLTLTDLIILSSPTTVQKLNQPQLLRKGKFCRQSSNLRYLRHYAYRK